MIASLPMYDRAETAAANDALWSAIHAELGFGPAGLDRTTNSWDVWLDPDLVLSQTCGLPYRSRLHGRVQLVGTPDYGLEDAPAGHYYSVFVCRKGDSQDMVDYRDRRFAYNEAGSQSGWAAPSTHVAELGFRFTKLLESGGHRDSARAVAEGRTDIAALDAMSWRMIQRYDEFANALQVIERTRPTPGLPLITSLGQDAELVLSAVRRALSRLDKNDAEILSIVSIEQIKSKAYLAIPTPPGP